MKVVSIHSWNPLRFAAFGVGWLPTRPCSGTYPPWRLPPSWCKLCVRVSVVVPRLTSLNRSHAPLQDVAAALCSGRSPPVACCAEPANGAALLMSAASLEALTHTGTLPVHSAAAGRCLGEKMTELWFRSGWPVGSFFWAPWRLAWLLYLVVI